MDRIDPPLPSKVIASVSSTMAHLYRIVPISMNGNTLTVAASHVVDQLILDELRTFLGFKVQSTMVSDDDLDRAIHRYYPSPPEVAASDCIHVFPHPTYSRHSELMQLTRRVFDCLRNPDVKHACLRSSADGLEVAIRCHTEEELIERFADGEFGKRLVERLKVMASIDIFDRSTQSRTIEIGVKSSETCVTFRFWTEGDVQLVELSRCGAVGHDIG